MKKILTLLIAVGIFATLHAQTREETRRVILGERTENRDYDERNNRDVVYGRKSRYPGGYSNKRQYEIDQTNREYGNKINSIRNNRYLSHAEKERIIRQLERDRQQYIAQINRRYNDRDDRYGRYDNGYAYGKSDNGKHKGWYKQEKNKNWRKGKWD